jgi:hypothetical protein
MFGSLEGESAISIGVLGESFGTTFLKGKKCEKINDEKHQEKDQPNRRRSLSLPPSFPFLA